MNANSNPVILSATEMGIMLVRSYDDTDSSVDYYRPYAQIDKFLIAVVDSKKRTEKLAREVIGHIPQLACLKWEWKKLEYSMGHGTFLLSEWAGSLDLTKVIGHKSYRGLETVHFRYEIQFDRYTKEFKEEGFYRVHSNFLGRIHQRISATPKAHVGVEGGVDAASAAVIHITKNDDKDGIEIRFPGGKPEQNVIDSLKIRRFRWSRFNGLWYKKFNPTDWEWAQKLYNRLSGSTLQAEGS